MLGRAEKSGVGFVKDRWLFPVIVIGGFIGVILQARLNILGKHPFVFDRTKGLAGQRSGLDERAYTAV